LRPVYEMPLLEGAASQQIFYYSAHWNFYYTCTQLSKLLPDEKAVIVAHDWLELGMTGNLGLQNPVVQIVHGNYDYYYELAKKHSESIDQFICVSAAIYDKLCSLLPERKADIHYCRFPVPSVQFEEYPNRLFHIFYCGRSLDSENKQFKILPEINAKLKSLGSTVHWTIIGKGINGDVVKDMMDQHENIVVHDELRNQKLLQLLPGHHIFLLPSLKEGFPVTVVEAMKAGLVPLVTDWEGATGDLIVEGKTGFYFAPGDANGYADAIKVLNDNRQLWKQMSEAGRQKANKMFDPSINTTGIESIILKAAEGCVKEKFKKKVYGSRLDQPWLPNFLVRGIRSFSR